MSLEQALITLNATIEKQNELLVQMLEASDAAASAEGGEEKPKRTRKTKETADAGVKTDAPKTETKSEESGLTHDQVKSVVGAWLGEFKADANDPETEARKGKIKAALAKLANKENATIADVPAGDLSRIITWLDKQKAADNGFGAGRYTAKPSADEADAGGEDDI